MIRGQCERGELEQWCTDELLVIRKTRYFILRLAWIARVYEQAKTFVHAHGIAQMRPFSLLNAPLN